MDTDLVDRTERIPVVRDIDVLVAGAGVSGVFSALAAARQGARVILVDRFGMLGGNMGASGLLIAGASGVPSQNPPADLRGPIPIPDIPHPRLVREFIGRAEVLLEGLSHNLPEIAHAYSYVAAKMARELGVELMLSAYVSDPILEGDAVQGLFVETKSGRVAVKAKVVIDATGDASVARRAGAPVIARQGVEGMKSPNMKSWVLRPEFRHWNDGGISYLLSGTDAEKFMQWYGEPRPLTAEQRAWRDKHFAKCYNEVRNWKDGIMPLFHEAALRGEFLPIREIRPGLFVEFDLSFEQLAAGLARSVATVYGEFDIGNWEDISAAEAGLREHIYDGVRFFRGRVPGFERASVISMSPFLGARGGPHIDAEFTATPQQMWEGFKHPDTMFIAYAELYRRANPRGHDAPYGMLVPKKVDGLLVTGRGAGWLRRGHDPSFRSRRQMMRFGEAAGIAAALCVRNRVQPRRLNVRELQQVLINEGFYLGDAERLRELGLPCPGGNGQSGNNRLPAISVKAGEEST